MIRPLLLVALALGGCSQQPSHLGQVTGQVTLDGQPLAGALVTFSPRKEGGSQSLGKTDDEGRYTLNYAPGINGAEPGEHQVSISTFQPAAPDADPPLEGVAERVPARYLQKSPLIREVKTGENQLDFPLTTLP